jgi:hypothetical protein
MTKLEIIENMIDNQYSENIANKFIKMYWNTIEKEVAFWSGSYFDKNIVSYMTEMFKLI